MLYVRLEDWECSRSLRCVLICKEASRSKRRSLLFMKFHMLVTFSGVLGAFLYSVCIAVIFPYWGLRLHNNV